MRLGINIAANAVSRVWLAVLQLALTPIIVWLLGPESYGLVGLNATIVLFLTFIDMAISNVLAREISASANDGSAAQRNANLLRTLEIISGVTGLIISGAVILLAPWIASHGLAKGGLSDDTLITSIRLIGLGIVCHWPGMLYGSGFIGLQRQDVSVAIRLVLGTVTAAGGALLLWLVQPSITLYLGWLALMALVTSAVLGIMLWRHMPAAPGVPRFDPGSIRRFWRFALGNLLVGLTTALVSQAPGLIVAKYCSLADLAAYALGMTLAQQIATILTQPISASLMPHFSALRAHGTDEELARAYHRWSRIVALLAMPPIATLVFFAKPLMHLWLGAASPLAGPTAALLPLAAIGMLFNILSTVPYALQTAAGWTRLSLDRNLACIVLVLPLVVMFTPTHGPIVAVASWLIANLGFCLISVPLMHRRLLKGHALRWWSRDVLWPIALATAFYGSAVSLLPDVTSPAVLAGIIVGLFLAYCGLLLVLEPETRALTAAAIAKVRGR